MIQLLEPGWWLSFAGAALPWWLVCVICSLAAWPLGLAVFRGLADRGAALAHGVGVIVVVYLSWLLSLGWFGSEAKAALVRLVLLLGASGALAAALLARQRGWVSARRAPALFYPAVVLGVLGLIKLPHGFATGWVAVLLLAGASVAVWWGRGEALRRAVRTSAVPLVMAQLVFLVAFLFFTNVRSYIPWATYELSLYQAEKWGNYTHLQAIMQSSSMPPRDLWFNGEPINYYYGGHLVTATLAKMTGTPVRVAFNLGLATIFALTMSMGFGFVLSLVHLTTRRMVVRRGVIWHHGMVWGLVGALAIGAFGNLDPLRQLFTRDVDWGVNHRISRERQSAQEEWKRAAGVPADVALRILGVAAEGRIPDRPRMVAGELRRAAAQGADTATRLRRLADDAAAVLERAKSDGTATRRRVADQLEKVLLTPAAAALYRQATGTNAVELEETIQRRVIAGEFEGLPALVRAAADGAGDYRPRLESMASVVEERMRAMVTSPEVTALNTAAQALLVVSPPPAGALEKRVLDAATRLDQAVNAGDYARVYTELVPLYNAAEDKLVRWTGREAQLAGKIGAAWVAMQWSPAEFLMAQWGGQPPTVPTNPPIASIRMTWQNISFIDFWASSRAIKGTPPGVREAGTITEFPYFSAILGDHHPHHSAIPYFLLAAAACLSLLRKNSRGWCDEWTALRRSWPELAVMAFAIGAVFPVNIWDAVVLAPIYALVILLAWRGVHPRRSWRWVGFGGFTVLLALIVSVLYNSMPGTVPLFSGFKLFLLAVAVLVGAMPLGLVLLRGRVPCLAVVLVAVSAALGLVLVNPLFAVVSPGPGAPSALALGVRDAGLFAIVAGIAAMWTLVGAVPATHRWWYSAGAVYAMVGVGSLFVILPFKLWFDSPLQPTVKLLADSLPPVLSTELTGATGRFWATFWSGSPINPFPRELRTELRDFFMHWGLFLVPVVVYTVVRFRRSVTDAAPGYVVMILGLATALLAVGRNYLGFWPGAIAMAMAVLALHFAFRLRGRVDSPVWLLLAGAFFWMWFVEALHFDDDYSGNYERYNTPFKIYYPIWAVMAGGAVAALRMMFAPPRRISATAARGVATSAGWWAMVVGMAVVLPALLAALVPAGLARVLSVAIWLVVAVGMLMALAPWIVGKGNRLADEMAAVIARAVRNWAAIPFVGLFLLVGLHYPIAATATRTREFHTWPLAESGEIRLAHREIWNYRTLDAIEHLQYFNDFRQDYKAASWLEQHADRSSKLLERATEEAYSPAGRMSTASGVGTILAWKHHEHQWRGRAKAAPIRMKDAYYDDLTNLTDMTTDFKAVISGLDAGPSAEAQRALRLADGKQRLRLLRNLVPDATLGELYRLRRAVERNDASMGHVMDAMLRHVNEIYTTKDRDTAARLVGRYGIDYVVVGELERRAHGNDLDQRLRDWGFEEIYNSAAPENRLPVDEAVINRPTRIYRVPEGFAPKTGGRS